MSLNVELLERIKAHVLAEPRRVDMDDWFTGLRFIEDSMRPPCGTVACIAGWACMLGGRPDTLRYEAGGVAAGLLGGIDTQALFFISAWPVDLRLMLDETSPGTPEYARIVAQRIDRFIATDGAE